MIIVKNVTPMHNNVIGYKLSSYIKDTSCYLFILIKFVYNLALFNSIQFIIPFSLCFSRHNESGQ